VLNESLKNFIDTVPNLLAREPFMTQIEVDNLIFSAESVLEKYEAEQNILIEAYDLFLEFLD